MRFGKGAPYNEGVRIGTRRGAAAAAILVLLLLAAVGGGGRALAQSAPANQTIPVGTSPFVRIRVRRGNVTIRTWDRKEVHVESSSDVDAKHFDARAVASGLHGDLPIFAATVQTPDGPMTLSPETFSLASVPQGDHDAVDVQGGDDGSDVTITVPSSTALVIAHVGGGRLTLENYHNGTFVTRVRGGAVILRNVSGTGFAETMRGPVVALDSTFERIRARSAAGNVFFERCTSRQIEVTTLSGNVVYDNGSFVPGLARFESQSGAIALGVASSDVRIDAHSGNGKVLTSFDRHADVVTPAAGETQATFGGARSIVTANSAANSVYLYDGSIRNHQRLSGEWNPLRSIVNRHHAPPMPHPHPFPRRR